MKEQLNDALNKARAIFPKDDITIGFQLEYEREGWTIPSYFIRRGCCINYRGRSPQKSLAKICRDYKITRVEQYIRCKESGL